jgi:type I restriction enzyme R subunit
MATDPALEMLYSFGRFLLPHLPLDREADRVKIGDEVGLQYYRLERIYSGEITLQEGEPEGVKSPTDVGTGKAKEEKIPLSEIIKVLNERFGTNFTDEDRFFFEQIREKATSNEQVVKLRRANPFDKFQVGLRQLIQDLMVQRMADNDRIVSRYMDRQGVWRCCLHGPIESDLRFHTNRRRDGNSSVTDFVVRCRHTAHTANPCRPP